MTMSHGWTRDAFDPDVDEAADATSGAPNGALQKIWFGFLVGSGFAALGGYPLVSLGAFLASMIFLATNDIRQDLQDLKRRR